MALFLSIFNLFRLAILLLACLLLYPFYKNRIIYWFLRIAGPSFVKLGQALATRPDLIGEEMAQILSHFQDRLEPFCARKVKKILIKEFGENYTKKFVEFDFIPKASASIAQVHQAKLLDGKIVAVKILRPNIKRIFARDIASLSLIALIVRLFSRYSGKTLCNINLLLKETSKTELNLLKEAANAVRLRDNMQKAQLRGFYVPQIFLHYSTANILVTEWIDGVPFSDKKALNNNSFDKKQIAQNLVVAYFTQVYSDGFFHADMHPGNLFLAKNGDIAVVDFGIMGEIDKKTRLAVAEIFIGFLHHDYKKVAQIHIDAGLVPQNTNLYELALSCQKIGEIIVDSSIKDISLAHLLAHLIEMTNQYKMATRPELLLLQKTLLLVEGVGVMLDEELNMWQLARPWVKEWAKKNIGFDAKIRDKIVELIKAILD